MVARLRADLEQLGLDNATISLGNAKELEFAESSFDVLLCGFTVALLPKPMEAIAGFARVMRPGGRIAVSMPTGAGPDWNFFGQLIGKYAHRLKSPAPPPPAPLPDPAILFGDTGLVDLRILDETEDFLFPNSDAWWSWVWSQGMRAMLELLPPDALEELRAEAETRLQPITAPDGSIPLHQGARYILARRNRAGC
jgi:SAM-dependent methyltransferase